MNNKILKICIPILAMLVIAAAACIVLLENGADNDNGYTSVETTVAEETEASVGVELPEMDILPDQETQENTEDETNAGGIGESNIIQDAINKVLSAIEENNGQSNTTTVPEITEATEKGTEADETTVDTTDTTDITEPEPTSAEEEVFTITYEGLEGVNHDNPVTYTASRASEITLKEPETRQGYEFVGWYLGDVLIETLSGQTGDLVLTAMWKKDGGKPIELPYVPF